MKFRIENQEYEFGLIHIDLEMLIVVNLYETQQIMENKKKKTKRKYEVEYIVFLLEN